MEQTDIEKIKNGCHNMRTARLINDLTLADAAKMLDISKATLSNYETGKTYPPINICRKMKQIYHMRDDNIVFYNDTECGRILNHG